MTEEEFKGSAGSFALCRWIWPIARLVPSDGDTWAYPQLRGMCQRPEMLHREERTKQKKCNISSRIVFSSRGTLTRAKWKNRLFAGIKKSLGQLLLNKSICIVFYPDMTRCLFLKWDKRANLCCWTYTVVPVKHVSCTWLLLLAGTVGKWGTGWYWGPPTILL